MADLKERCKEIYESVYADQIDKLTSKYLKSSKSKSIPISKLNEFETHAQKEAIRQSTISTINEFPDVEPAIIWKTVYEIHVHRKSGIDDADTIARVISADQSWKKSSGHAFEEMIKFLGNSALIETNIRIVLQRDLSVLIKNGEISNAKRDIDWLNEQIKAAIFDLYAIVEFNEKNYVFGCIQSKTSIRDRVTRDREPSIQAMDSFFWSTIVVLDGDFLKNPKFITMVNGGSVEHPTNGWHGMYVFSEKYTSDRIYPTNTEFKNFKEHAIEAADYWLQQRQWFNSKWKATDIEATDIE